MPDPNIITATETRPGGPPSDLHVQSTNAKVRWATKNPPADPNVSFAGQTILVTGANTGLGYEASLKYAALGAERLILGVRSKTKGEEAKQRIVKATGFSASNIDILTVDLTSFDSVHAFVKKLNETTNKLDVALLNAGLGNPSYVKSSTGWEMAVQVNVLSTALMAVHLLPLLRATAAQGRTPHLTFVNSNGHDMTKREWLGPDGSLLQAANKEKGWVAEQSYSMVKLAGMAVMQHIAKASERSGIIVNAVCPGLCKTDLGRNFGVVQRLVGGVVLSFIARTAEQGSRTLVSGTALGPESHGRFWHLDVLYPIGEMAKDEGLMKQTWDEVWDVITKDRPELHKTLHGDS